jgi:hypothetical protein
MDSENQQGQAKDDSYSPSATQRPTEKIIQPVNISSDNPQQQNIALINTSKVDTNSIYPNATAGITDTNINASQAFAMNTVQAKTKESNRLVCLRVKSVLIIGLLVALSSIYTIIEGLRATNGTVILVVLGLVQLAMSFGLLFSKDHNTVALLLKIFLVLQVVGLFMSLANPTRLVINGVVLIFLCYAYFRVRSLSYY